LKSGDRWLTKTKTQVRQTDKEVKTAGDSTAVDLVRREVVESKAPCSSSMPSRMALYIIFTSTPLNAMRC